MMRPLFTRSALWLALLLGVLAAPRDAFAQKALVYCPPSDTSGCDAIAAALTGAPGFPGGVAKAYDGTLGSIDLKTADLNAYGVLIVPSLSDDVSPSPYGLLRDSTVVARLRNALLGRRALYSGSPDQGSTNADMKSALVRNLASWAAGNFATANGPGLVVLRDATANDATRYGWLRGILGVNVTADPAVKSYASVRALTGTATEILTASGSAIAYTNMAAYGFQVPSGAANVTLDAVGQTGTAEGGQVVLVTMQSGNTGGASVMTDKDDYAPGTTVTITGSGFAAGETVKITLHEDPTVHEDRTITATADQSGKFVNTSFAPEEHHLGVRFVLTAVGQTSGNRAQTTFTDGVAYELQGQSKNSQTWVKGDLVGWQELDLIPVRVRISTASGNNDPGPAIVVKFDHASGATQGIQSLTYVSSTNITFANNQPPTLTKSSGDVWEVTFSATRADPNREGFVEFRARLGAGAHAFGGNSLAISGSPSLGNLPINKPAPGAGTPDLKVVKGATASVTPSGTISYTLNYENKTGASSPAVGVQITDVLPSNVTLVSNSCSPACVVNGNELIWDIATGATSLGAGASGSVSFQATVNANVAVGSTITNTAAIRSAQVDANAADNTSSATTTVVTATAGTSLAVAPATGTFGGTTTLSATLTSGTTKLQGKTITFTVNGTTVCGASPLPTCPTTDANGVATLSNVGLSGINAGTYAPGTSSGIVANFAAEAGYAAASGTATLTVGQATPTFTGVTVDNAAYDGNPHGASATVSGVAGASLGSATVGYELRSGSGTAGDPYTYGTSTSTAPSAAGVYRVTFSYAGSTSYVAISNNTNTLTISATSASVTLGNLSREYGAANPTTGFSIASSSGFVGADAPSCNNYQIASTATATAAAGSTHAITATCTATNYTVTANPGTLTITKATPTVTATGGTFTYNGSAQAGGGSATGVGGAGDVLSPAVTLSYSGTGTTTYGPTASAPTSVGTYAVTASFAGSTNYNAGSSTPAALTINAASVSFTIGNTTQTYSGSTKAVSVTPSVSGVTYSVAYTQGGQPATPTNVGTYNVTVTSTDPNYSGSSSGTLTIDKATPTLTWAAIDPITYGTTLSGLLNASSNGVVGSFSYANGNTTVTATTVLEASTTAYTLTATFTPTDQANYNGGTVQQTLTVNKATQSITFGTLSNKTFGDAAFAVGATATSGLDVSFGATGACTVGQAIGGGSWMVTITGAGSCSVTASQAGNTNYSAATDVTRSFTVAKATASIAFSNVTHTYDGTAKAVTATTDPTGLSGVGVKYYQGTGASEVEVASPTNAGTYTVKATLNHANYQLAAASNPTVGTLTINKASQAALAVTSPTAGTFGQAYAMSASGGTGSGTLSYAVVSGSTACTIATSGPNAGKLEITSGTGTCSITASRAGGDNYNDVTSPAAEVTISKAAATLALGSLEHTYDGTAKAATATTGPVTGLSTVTITYYQPGATTEVAAANVKNAGSYAVKATLANANYAADEVTGTLVIAPKAASVTVQNLSRAYGAANPTTGFSVGSPTGFLGADAPSCNNYQIASTATATAAAGSTHAITATCTATNYTVTANPGTLTIDKAVLTVTANNVQRQYSDLVTFTSAITGFVNGESQSVVSGTVTYGGAAATAVNVGNHVITPVVTGLSATNYSFAPANGTLTITHEDARVDYNGLNFWSTSSSTNSVATVTFRATIQDITALPSDAAYDANAGDIRTATVTFVNRDNGSTLCTASLSLVNGSDTKTATAACNASVDIGNANSASYTVGTIVGPSPNGPGNYTRNSSADNEVVTVSKLISGGFITGGGYLINQASSGQYAGKAGLRSNFGFNVKTTKSGSNLQGAVNIIVRGENARVYQIKSNAISSANATLASGDPKVNPGVALFLGKANLQDITNPLAPISLGGNLNLEMMLTDKGEPGNDDSIGFTLYNGSQLLFSSRWSGTKTVEQQLNPGNGNGNVQVR